MGGQALLIQMMKRLSITTNLSPFLIILVVKLLTEQKGELSSLCVGIYNPAPLISGDGIVLVIKLYYMQM